MAKNLVLTTSLERWNDLVLLNQKFLGKFVFRGQADSSWDLSTSLERMVKLHTPNYVDKNLPAIYESNMLSDFKWKYPLYEKQIIPDINDNLEWLALMQHYGAPTRLLDFTNSLFVALFMALDNSFCESSCIWGINRFFVDRQATKLCLESEGRVPGSISHTKLEQFKKEKANSYIDVYRPEINNELYIITPTLCNERISHQQGLFIMPSNIQIPFQECLDAVLSTAEPKIENINVPIKDLLDYSYTDSGKVAQNDILLFKINIPKKHKLYLTKLLNQMNVTAETLYPGLAGMAKSMSYLRHGMNEYDE